MMRKLLLLAVTVIISAAMCGCGGKTEKEDEAADSIRRADSARRADSLFVASLPLTKGQVMAANINDPETHLLLATEPDNLKPGQLATACVTSLYFLRDNKTKLPESEEAELIQYIITLYDRGMELDPTAFEKTAMYYMPEDITDFSEFSKGIKNLRHMAEAMNAAK
ncbi:MAG: hypothetical protein K2M79_06910 [Muribaculaceae bacterium]|nr:hypothetical protein [Muribaculaceae bacterium]